jgi:hypothetical protein
MPPRALNIQGREQSIFPITRRDPLAIHILILYSDQNLGAGIIMKD